MHLNIKHFVVFITILLTFSCREPAYRLSEIHAKQLPITDSISSVDSIENVISPYRNRLNEVLDEPISYAPRVISKNDGRYNSSAGNLMADIVFEQANPIFTSRKDKGIDFVVLNHGGIRSVISKGNITSRTAYEVMPFENKIVVLELKGKAVRDLVTYLVRSGRPHPISGLQIILEKNDQLSSVNIQGQPFDEKRTYYVATSDYLANGGDAMHFFKEGTSRTETDYLLRNAMIDYFKKTDTLKCAVDDRFINRDSL